MKRIDREKLVKLKKELSESNRKFKLGCYVCHAKKARGGMTFHHLEYLQGEKTYADFKNPLDYYIYLEKQIRENPKRFLYVCNVHHQAIERLARWKGKNRERLIKAVRMTK